MGRRKTLDVNETLSQEQPKVQSESFWWSETVWAKRSFSSRLRTHENTWRFSEKCFSSFLP